MHRDQRPPIVTLTSDFGTRDAYVAAMKAAVLNQCPEATLVDVTHEVPRHDVTAGSIVLERAWHAFRDAGTRVVHLCVVDPGVGTGRDIVLTDVGGSLIVCPDNGLLTWVCRRWPALAGEVWRLSEVPPGASRVFHGRDVMAPLAGKLARGAGPHSLHMQSKPMAVMLDLHPVQPEARAEGGSRFAGRVIQIDHFGNCTTNVVADGLGEPASWRARVAGRELGPLRRTYADVAPGEPLALVSSSDLIEIAVREGSAAQAMGIAPGTPVELERLR